MSDGEVLEWRQEERKAELEPLKEVDQLAVLDTVDKAAITFVLKDSHTAELVGNPTPAPLCLNDPKERQQNCRELHSAKNTMYPYCSSLQNEANMSSSGSLKQNDA